MKKLLTSLLLCSIAPLGTQAQWSIDSLSAPYSPLAVTQNGSKAIFAAGTKYELYDVPAGTWATRNMVVARPNVKAATAAGRSYFGGGGFITVNSYNFYNNVDVYNATTNAWSTAQLSQARIVGASAAVGNKVFFAGGRQILNYSNRVDIFDVTTGVRTTHALSQARTNMAVAVVGSKVIFAGGETGNISNGVYTESNKVDIYDDATGLWSTALLSVKREQITPAVVGTKALFAGGIGVNGVYSNRIDIYDAATNTWSTKNMSETKYGIAAATAGNTVYLAGGTTSNSGALTNRVEVYNATTNTLSYVTISSPRMSMAVGQTPGHILFAGGVVTWGNVGTDRVEVLDLASNTWSVEYLSRPRLNLAAASYGTRSVFAGGAEVLSGYPQYTILSKRVDIYDEPVLHAPIMMPTATSAVEQRSLTVYPNPTSSRLSFDANVLAEGITSVQVFDLLGARVEVPLVDRSKLDVNALPTGNYVLVVKAGSTVYTARFMKE